MKAHLIGALAICLLSVSVVEGQTVSEQLQRAIYTQSMLGDLDEAIRLYQQIIATSPATSEVRTQAARLLAAAEAHRRATPPALATFDGRVYRHLRTGITFDVPRGWNVDGTNPSSDDGEQMYISIPSPGAIGRQQLVAPVRQAGAIPQHVYPKGVSSQPSAEASVWMIAFPQEIDQATIEQQLGDAPLMKMRQRSQSGYLNLDDWRLREGSIGRSTVGGKAAVGALADYRVNGRDMVEAMMWVVTNKSRAFFALRLTTDDFNNGLLVTFHNMIQSAKVP